jgi:uncharacterized protein
MRERDIPVRRMDFDFSEVPRHWFRDSAFLTHVANGLNLVFPAGERFFIRSVKHMLDRIDDPDLLGRVRGFFGQEARHGLEHERAFAVLEAQGYEIRSFLAWYEHWAFEWLEPRVPATLRLSITVALEHFTATLAEQALTTDALDHADPAMRALLRWHAAEEIEHKSVAFDVLQRVDPRYRVRIAGLAVATVGLLFFWRAGTRMLLAQEPPAVRRNLGRERRAARAHGHDDRFLLRAIASYLRRDFHPDRHDNLGLAKAYLASIGRLTA